MFEPAIDQGTAVSGDGDSIPYVIHDRFTMWRETLVTIAANPELVINIAMATHYSADSAPTGRELPRCLWSTLYRSRKQPSTRTLRRSAAC